MPDLRLFTGVALMLGAFAGVLFAVTTATAGLLVFRQARRRVHGLPLYAITAAASALVTLAWCLWYVRGFEITPATVALMVAVTISAGLGVVGLIASHQARFRRDEQ